MTRSITGHVTEEMREHYSTVDLAERREAVAAVTQMLGLAPKAGQSETVDRTVDRAPENDEGHQGAS